MACKVIGDAWQRTISGTESQYVPRAGAQAEGAGERRRLHRPRVPDLQYLSGLRLTDAEPDRAKEALAQLRDVSPCATRQSAGRRTSWTPARKQLSGLPPRGMGYWQRLNDVMQAEPVEPRDIFFHAMLRPLGLEKGKPFRPDPREQKISPRRVGWRGDGKANSADRRFKDEKYRPDAHWDFALRLDADDPEAFWSLFDERASWFYEAVGAGAAMAPKRPGPSSAYLSAYKDKADVARWRQIIPPAHSGKSADPAVLVGHAIRCRARALILNDQRIADRSSRMNMDLRKNADGFGGHLLRTGTRPPASRRIDPDRARQELVCVFPFLPTDRGLLPAPGRCLTLRSCRPVAAADRAKRAFSSSADRRRDAAVDAKRSTIGG